MIKEQIFNHPFYIFDYALKTKYENLEFKKIKIPITFFMLKFKSLIILLYFGLQAENQI